MGEEDMHALSQLAGGARVASISEYQKNAAACARLARIAPSPSGRASFAAAAEHWRLKYRRAAEFAEHPGAKRRMVAEVGKFVTPEMRH
jgi:hypothetical protein